MTTSCRTERTAHVSADRLHPRRFKCTAAVVFALWLMSSPALAESLAKLSLDNPSTLGTTIQADPAVKTEGRSSVKITTLHPTTICLGQVLGLDVEKATVIYAAKVRSALEGAAYLEMWVQVGGGRYFSRGLHDTIAGRSGWKSIQTPFRLREGQRPDKIVLNIVINGIGTVWVDDLTLGKAPLN